MRRLVVGLLAVVLITPVAATRHCCTRKPVDRPVMLQAMSCCREASCVMRQEVCLSTRDEQLQRITVDTTWLDPTRRFAPHVPAFLHSLTLLSAPPIQGGPPSNFQSLLQPAYAITLPLRL